MSEQENLRINDEAFAALNAHDLNRFAQYFADDFQAELPDVPGRLNKQQYLDYIKNYLTGFPDLHFQVDRTIAKDETVVALWTFMGTHTGPLNGPNGTIPATGKKLSNRGINIGDNKSGKVMRLVTLFNQVPILQQLGLIPG